MKFSYLAEKVSNADHLNDPFLHVQINDFFSAEHFAELTKAPELNLCGFKSDEQLFDAFFDNGYKIIDFPGCVTDKNEYLRWHKTKRAAYGKTNTACEGYGMTLRLMAPKTAIVEELKEFLSTEEFLDALADKFNVDRGDVFSDNGIQKYLDGYEISPHPDIRKKALTYMVNLNPAPDADKQEHHTHYLRFRDEFKFIETYWAGNPKKDRCWVPWDWCETQKMQRENNSIVIFSPNNQTIHGVKANYNHLTGQRTQLYGNFWYHTSQTEGAPQWEDYAIADAARPPEPELTFRDAARAAIPKQIRTMLKNRKPKPDKNVISDRLYSR